MKEFIYIASMSHKLEENSKNDFRPAILGKIHEVHTLVSALLEAIRERASHQDQVKLALQIKSRVLTAITQDNFRLNISETDDICVFLRAFMLDRWVLTELAASPNFSSWSIVCTRPAAFQEDLLQMAPELENHARIWDQEPEVRLIRFTFDENSVTISTTGAGGFHEAHFNLSQV